MESKYMHIQDEEFRLSTSDYSKEDAPLTGEYRGDSPKWWKQKPIMNLTAIIATISIIVVSNSVTALVMYSLARSPPGTLTEISVFSPVHNRVKLPLVDKMMDRTAAPNASNPEHIYRLAPSPKVDAAWDRISDIGMFPTSRDEIIKIQKDPDLSVIPPESWGMGKDEHGNPNYFMEVDVFHQLHCLNALRKGLVYNYDYYHGHKYGFTPRVNFERHLNHCLDMLRQSLMCHADVEAVTFNWRETQNYAYSDFGVHRTCKDWDTLLEWSDKNKMPDMVSRFRSFKKPDDAVQIPAPPDMPKKDDEGVVQIPSGQYVKPLTGLAGVEYCMGSNRDRGVEL